jgi:hypothetical protein
MLERMARARELAVMRDVKRAVVTRAGIVAKLEEHVAREVPREEIRAEDAFLKALGVIAQSADYERDVYAAIRESAGGMYEPFDQTMYLPDDLAPETLAVSLAHESVHALQDQHFDLRAFERYMPGATDEMLARSCLAEGDATEATGEEPEALATRTYVERELAAPYVVGTAFVRALEARGGWAEVDRAWTRGGLTTEQVLHPEKWVANERAERVEAPTFAALGPAFRSDGVDVKGELSLRLVLETAVPEDRARDAASGWAGDAAVLAHDGARTALAWRIRFDDEASAARARTVMANVFSARACTSVTAKARDVLLLVGPEGECGALARWSSEVLR